MSNISINQENVEKAYQEGCVEVRKTLGILFPFLIEKPKWTGLETVGAFIMKTDETPGIYVRSELVDNWYVMSNWMYDTDMPKPKGFKLACMSYPEKHTLWTQHIPKWVNRQIF